MRRKEGATTVEAKEEEDDGQGMSFADSTYVFYPIEDLILFK